MKNCSVWREYDFGEVCRGSGKSCSCSGVLLTCNYPQYFNIPKHRIKAQREKDRIDDTVADVELFVGSKENQQKERVR